MMLQTNGSTEVTVIDSQGSVPEGKWAKRFGGAGARAGELSEGGYAGGGLGCR